MIVEKTGSCPEQNGEEYTIEIEYSDYGTREGILHSKGRHLCRHQKEHGCPKANTCPIWKAAEDELRD